MRTWRYILLFALFLSALSCRKDLEPWHRTDGRGSIILHLDSRAAVTMQTKALSAADSLKDGYKFNNVLVILADNSGKVVDTVFKRYPYTPYTGSIQTAAGSSPTQDTIRFNNLLPGNYTAFAYANIDATLWQDGTISANEKNVAPGSSFSTFFDRQMLSLTGTSTPADTSMSASMLLTGKLDIPVGLSVVKKELKLLRPVVRFNVTVRNNTPYPVSVDELRFSNFNPDKAFLLDHLNASGVPAVPDGVTYRELPAFVPGVARDTVAAQSTGVVYTTLLYENAAPDTYKIFATVTLDRSEENLSNLSFLLGTKPFGPIDAATLNSMSEGETVDVLLINPRSAVRSGRLYYGIGASGYTAWESCGYTSFNGFQARAQAIYNQTNSAFPYTGFTYNGWINSKSGFAGWTGNTADAPSTASTFNYVGKRSTYFHTLTKVSGNLFTLSGLAIGSPASGSSLSNIRIVKGKNVSNKFPVDIDENVLLRIYQSASGNTKLKSDCVWGDNNTTEEQAKYTSLVWDTGDNQDHQFVMFGKFDDPGAALKRILKENFKEVPLTYMARNEEINVILNVYYSDQEGSLTFEVDNSHWTDSNATVSEHTFN